jgi:hypothetical protein
MLFDYSITDAQGREMIGANGVTLVFALSRIYFWFAREPNAHRVTITRMKR